MKRRLKKHGGHFTTRIARRLVRKLGKLQQGEYFKILVGPYLAEETDLKAGKHQDRNKTAAVYFGSSLNVDILFKKTG